VKLVKLARGGAGAKGGGSGPLFDEVVPWDPEAGTLDPKALEGAYAVIHLAGQLTGAASVNATWLTLTRMAWLTRGERGLGVAREPLDAAGRLVASEEGPYHVQPQGLHGHPRQGHRRHRQPAQGR
jgi:hypothetical protein